MLKLTLLRHAKSSWEYPYLEDFLRPLNKRGYRQAIHLAEQFPSDVDTIWCSPAIRAYTTVQCLLADLPELSPKLELKEEIYEASSAELLDLLKTATHQRHIALVGHNPGFEMLAGVLTNSYISMKTAHCVQLELDCDNWDQLSRGDGRMIAIWRPDEE